MTPFTHLVNLGELTAFAALLFVAADRADQPAAQPDRRRAARRCGSWCGRSAPASTASCSSPSSPRRWCRCWRWRCSSAPRSPASCSPTPRPARPARRSPRKRVIEESLALQQRELAGATVGGLNDDVMVWISRVIDQDVNLFDDLDAARRRASATCSRRACCRRARRRRSTAPSPRSAADLRRPRIRSATFAYLRGRGAGPRRRRATRS